ncbi:DUF5916 domain-containing protein [Fulvivirga imtechensis]|nr:DUF5916 domain-containing protein [Fulvivirga imtechensis]
MVHNLFCITILVLLALHSKAQINKNYQLGASKITTAVKLDGSVNDEVWTKTSIAGNFIQNFPVDSVPATSQTEVMFLFDDEHLYIGGVCRIPTVKKPVIQSLRRDFNASLNESVRILFDPYDDHTNGFAFGLSSLGVQYEGLVTNGQSVSTDWDNKWYSEVVMYDDRWEFEIAIPFKTLRYNADSETWNIILLRNDLTNNERSTWAPVPQGYETTSFAFSGKLVFDHPLPKPGLNISLIPYLSAAANKNHYENGETLSDFDAGFDAKVGVSASLNLDLTVNPDFSQVEVDRQVTNLSRFEIYFPERRQFFLENQDMFGEGGFRESRPFFSRRVGIARDTAGNNVQIPIQFGARLSGKIGKNWRIGMLSMNTKAEDGVQLTGAANREGTYWLPAQNYSVAVVQRKVFSRSNIGAFMVNRQALDYESNEDISTTTQYNRVVGVDYNLFSADGKWEGDFFYHRSIDEGNNNKAFSNGAFLMYNNTNLTVAFIGSSIGEDFNAELGFVPRKDIIELRTFDSYRFYTPAGASVNNHGPGIDFGYITDQGFNKTDLSYNISYGIRFENTAALSFGSEYRYEKLRATFDPTRTGGEELPEGSGFSWRTYGATFNTDTRRLFSVEGEASFGGFYNGDRINVFAQFNYRYQPFGSIALLIDYNDIDLPAPFNDAQFWLIGPRIDLTFTDKLFLTTFVQYNEQQDNVNLNARFQWRYKPVSDIFVVYTDNYFPGHFEVKSRALVFKITYWLNI